MKIIAKYILTSCAVLWTISAPAQNLFTSKKKLINENRVLKAQVEMLSNANDSLRAQISFASDTTENEAIGMESPIEEYNAEVTDSLLTIWYLHRQLNENKERMEYDMDSVKFSSNVPDSVMIKRLESMNSFISLPYNENVRNFMILYSEKMPTKMGLILGLSKHYMPIFEETFLNHGLPLELKYLAIIESALNPTATSRAGARGMWQFMYTTAKGYGLEINSYVDERLDPYASADAAARYLKDAYQIFGDWSLAISSYNCGSGNVNKAIRRSGGKRDFWSIYPYLPRETRGYVPAMVGAMYAMSYAKEYGLEASPVLLPSKVDTFHINKNLHLRQVSEVIGIPMEDLRHLNPQYYNDIIPGNQGEYILRLPFNCSSDFIENEEKIYAHRANEVFTEQVTIGKYSDVSQTGGNAGATWVTYKVKNGDTLGAIAKKYKVRVSDIQKWNNIKGTNIRVGQKLKIKSGKGAVQSSSSSQNSSKTASKTSSQGSVSEEYTTYEVKSGDTLFKIAQLYPGVSAQDIQNANGGKTTIHPGQKLRIPKKK